MSSGVTRVLGAVSAGVLFGTGLVVSGMTNPHKVLAFLDPLGGWDPSLAFVMVGAIGVYALAHRLTRKLRKPLAAHEFHVPSTRNVDARLLFGAGTFGVGWGLAGYCPGPSVVAVGSGNAGAGIFVIAILAGIAVVHYTGHANTSSGIDKGAAIP